MTSPRTPRTGFHRALALLALAPACAWFSAPVQAGCAHPLGVVSGGSADYRIDSLRRLGVVDAETASSPLEPSRPDRPCSGPNCKRNDAPSQTPPHVSVSLRIDGCLPAAWLEAARQGGTRLRPVEPPLSSILATTALERPPRA